MAGLHGKTALVTGASRGIGRAVAQRLAADGAVVAVHYGRDGDAAKETVAAIEQANGHAFPLRAEFGASTGLDTLFEGLSASLDGRQLDILVSNAGILEMTPLEQITPEEFDRVFAVNVRAPLFIIQRALPLMRDGGRIVNISSAVTRIALPFLTYAMSKGAIDVLGHTLAQSLGARQITVNTVAPAWPTGPAPEPGRTARRPRQGSSGRSRSAGSGNRATSPTSSPSSLHPTHDGSPASRSTPAVACGSVQPQLDA
jgi:NAD(P)-dependent dehydrogenase (short-subunit alcohol dehydrogenase family)